MNATSTKTIELARHIANRGFTVCAIEIHTPDGRMWSASPKVGGKGYQLFELNFDGRRPTEHDTDGADSMGDLADYLEAITK